MLARSAPLLLSRDVVSSAAFGTDQMQALALLSVKLFEQGFNVALVFFGIDCLVIGWLIFRSPSSSFGRAGGGCGAVLSDQQFRVFPFPTLALPPTSCCRPMSPNWR